MAWSSLQQLMLLVLQLVPSDPSVRLSTVQLYVLVFSKEGHDYAQRREEKTETVVGDRISH